MTVVNKLHARAVMEAAIAAAVEAERAACGEDGAIRLLRAVSNAAPARQNKWVREARIPWALINEIREALRVYNDKLQQS